MASRLLLPEIRVSWNKASSSFRGSHNFSFLPPTSSVDPKDLTGPKPKPLLPRRFLSSGPKASVKAPSRDKVLTVPNLLCVSRILMSPYIAHLIISGDFPLALALFGYAGLTDLADGWIARNFKGQESMLGSFLDPLADKILVASLYLSLTSVGLIPLALTSLIISRDVFLIYAGMYVRYMAVIPPFTVKKYFDLKTQIAQIQPPMISKANTLVQLLLIGSALAAPVYGFSDHSLMIGLYILTAGTTFASACSYAFMTDAFKITHGNYDPQYGKRGVAFTFFVLFNLGFIYKMYLDKSQK